MRESNTLLVLSCLAAGLSFLQNVEAQFLFPPFSYQQGIYSNFRPFQFYPMHQQVRSPMSSVYSDGPAPHIHQGAPVAPIQPNAPNQPSNLVEAFRPVSNAQPNPQARPIHLAAPNKPSRPFALFQPDNQPGSQIAPIQPAAPNQPGDLVAPFQHVSNVQPGSQQVAPIQPAAPNQPDIRVEILQPAAPIQSGPPVESVQSVLPPNNQKVGIKVFYETNCPDSMRFITKQLYPVYQQMGDIVSIQFVPFGKARANYDAVSKKYSFSCQHGPRECYGNTVQGCALTLLPSFDDQINFINCMMSYPRPSESGSKCANRLGLDWKMISKCADGEDGMRILYSHGENTNTLNPPVRFIPRIHINEVYSDSIQNRALKDLKGVVCESYKGQSPHSMCQ